jgi:hypothetical protein
VRAAFLSALVLAVFGAPSAASACTIPDLPPEERVERADRAIYGRVLSRESLGPNERGIGEAYRYRFRVIERYKGRIRRRITLTSQTDSATCGIPPLKVGDRHGLLLFGRSGPWSVGAGSFISRADLRRVRRPKRV